MPRVVLIGNLAHVTGGVAEFDLPATSVQQLFRQLTDLHPALGPHLQDGVAVAIDGQIYQDALLQPIGAESEVYVLPQIAGGSNDAPTFDVLFEDDALIFVNKPAGVVVQQRMHHPDEPWLHAEVQRHTSPAYLMQRLDRDTSGVMFFSKRADVNARLTRQFEQKRIRKQYLAVCEGELVERQTVDQPLARVGAIKFAVREGGKPAITHIRPLHATPAGSLLEIGLETGRTHQIRVHLSAIGHPLAGDWLYGERNAARTMLHAAELEMTHPVTHEPLRVLAPLPDDFVEEAQRRGLRLA